MSLYGTEGSYEEQTNARVWNTKRPRDMTDLSELLACKGVQISEEERGSLPEALAHDFFQGVSAVHDVSRLPREFLGLRNGHSGSHQFLVCDFLESVVGGKLPPNNVWAAARYCLPGIIAHESALRDGEQLPIPDLGDPPR